MSLRTRIPRGDDGQLLLLVLVYAAIALSLVVVVVDVSKLFLYKRALSGAADGAALAASQSADEGQLLTGGVGATIPLSQDSVEAAVERYVRLAGLERRFDGLTWMVTTDGATATVTLRSDVALPFVGVVQAGDGTVDVSAEASARSQVTP